MPKKAKARVKAKLKAKPKVKPVPQGLHTATPYLFVHGAARAIDFYKVAFNAKELMRMPAPGGRVGHAQIKIGDSHIMLSDESPDMGAPGPKKARRLAGDDLPLCEGRGHGSGAGGGSRSKARTPRAGSVLRRPLGRVRGSLWPHLACRHA